MGSMSTPTSTSESPLICMRFQRHVLGLADDSADVRSAWGGINTACTLFLISCIIYNSRIVPGNKNAGHVSIIYSSDGT